MVGIGIGIGNRRWGGVSFDPEYYNTTVALAGLRTAIANRATTPVGILCDGDSITERYNAGRNQPGIGTGFVDVLKVGLANEWPTTGVANMAVSNYLPTYFVNGSGYGYTPYSALHGSPLEVVGGYGLGLRSGQLNATGDGWTWTQTCSSAFVDIVSAADVANGKVAIEVDGVAVAGSPFDTGNGTLPYISIDTGISTYASHTIKVTRDATSTKNIRVAGVRVYADEKTKGFHVYESGKSGYTASLTNGLQYYRQLFYAGVTLHWAVIEFGLNELVFSESTATFKTALETKVSRLRALWPNICISFLFVPCRGNAASNSTLYNGWLTSYAAYVAAAKQIVAANPTFCSVIDTRVSLGTAAAMQPATPVDTIGYFDTTVVDYIHPGAAGHSMIAAKLRTAVVDSAKFPVSTPLVVEGDSNTAWTYATVPNWLKVALAKSGGRFYLPVGGDFAWAGATIASASGAGANSMEGRQAAVVAKITDLVSKFGRCVLWFQIGTNASADTSGDIAILASAVAAYKAAGAKVYCNLAPEFFVNSYRTALNAAIRAGTVPVDGYVDPTPAVILGAGKTHYVEAEQQAVGQLVADFLIARTTPNTIYTDPIAGFTVDTLSGTSGTLGTGGSGQLPTGWTGSRPAGDGTATYSVSGPDGSGLYTMQIAVTAGASNTTFIVSKSQSLSFSTGDVIDGGATMAITSRTDASTVMMAYADVGGAAFPKASTGFGDAANWATPSVWRGYPINQAAGGSSFTKRVGIQVAAGKSATMTVKGMFHVVREASASVAPVNVTAPTVADPIVGGSPAISAAGTWTGSPTPTLTYQYYLDETSIASGYTFVSGDIGKLLTAYETATNTAGSQTVVSSNAVAVTAASTAPVWNTAVQNGGNNLVYSGSDATVGRNNATGVIHVKGLAAITGKKHFEVAVTDDDTISVSARVGICDSSVSAASAGTNGTNCAYRTATGTDFYTGGSTGSQTAFSSSGTNKVAVEVDADAQIMRIAVNGGAWSADRSISGLASIYAYACFEADATLSFRLLPQGEWASALSSGYAAL